MDIDKGLAELEAISSEMETLCGRLLAGTVSVKESRALSKALKLQQDDVMRERFEKRVGRREDIKRWEQRVQARARVSAIARRFAERDTRPISEAEEDELYVRLAEAQSVLIQQGDGKAGSSQRAKAAKKKEAQ
jgi:hypothetical protein